jgi:hypothetical protein
MAGMILPTGADPNSYRGLPSLYEFVNSDGALTRYNCGQAAACTILSHFDAISGDACSLMTAVEEAHPPDNLFGWLGTSRRRVERICEAYGVVLEEIYGEDAVRGALAENRPVAMMVQVPGPRVWRWQVPAGHWMVAYGFDDRQVFLSNYHAPGMPWDDFLRAWNGFVPRIISMRNTGLVARSS